MIRSAAAAAAELEPLAGDDQAGPLVRAFAGEVDDVNADRRYIVSRISTEGVDRYKTVILGSGMRQDEFERDNRLVLWEHGADPQRGRLPIGRSSWIKYRPDRGQLVARTDFAKDDYAQLIFEQYRDGILRGWSINGDPSKAKADTGPPTAAELRAHPDWSAVKTVYRSWMLREYSGVVYPGNVDALTEEVSRSISRAAAAGVWIRPEILERLNPITPPAPPPATPELPPLVGRTLEDVSRELVSRCNQLAPAMLRQALQDAREIARGRV